MSKQAKMSKPYLAPETELLPVSLEQGFMGASTDGQSNIEDVKELDQFVW